MGRKRKRIVCVSDLHCGQRVGLTHPDYQWDAGQRDDHIWRKCAQIQRECWKWYAAIAKRLRPIDVLMVNGDAIDGRGERSGGVELITADRAEQIEMAQGALEIWGTPHIAMTGGTEYHVGDKESWEGILAKKLKAKIGDHEWVEVAFGKKVVATFDLKHFVGGSQIPYGRATARKRELIWNQLWADAGLQPRADWIIRSHVHYCEGGFQFFGPRMVWALTTPALQAMGTRYGARRCSGLVDYGLIWWDFTEDGLYTWDVELATIPAQKARALRV